MKYQMTPVKQKIKNNVFEVTIRFMHGDADAYTTETFTVKTEEKLEQVVKSFNDLREFEDSNQSGYDEVQENAPFEVPGDCTADFQFRASCDDINIHYFDENGKKFLVEIKDNNGKKSLVEAKR